MTLYVDRSNREATDLCAAPAEGEETFCGDYTGHYDARNYADSIEDLIDEGRILGCCLPGVYEWLGVGDVEGYERMKERRERARRQQQATSGRGGSR
jgi:hypothetical protein